MKTNDAIMELLHKEIDGLNSTDDSARLHTYLGSHPEAAQMYEELRELSSMLEEVPQLTPGTHVSARIMNSIRSISGARNAPRSIFTILNVVRLKPGYAFAAGFALGCILLISLAKYQSDSNVDASHLLGTIVNSGTLEKMENINTVVIDAKGLKGTIVAERSENIVLVKITVNAARLTTLRTTFTGEELTFKGYVDLRNSSSHVIVEANDLRSTLLGEHEYAMLFDANAAHPSSFSFEASQDNIPVFTKTVETSVPNVHR